MNKVKIECENCKGSGYVKYKHIADGICFQCEGKGFILYDKNKAEQIEKDNRDMEQYRKAVLERKEKEYQSKIPQSKYSELLNKYRNKYEGSLSEWENNFLFDICDKPFVKLSPKQKAMIFKITNKFEHELQKEIESLF